MGSCLGTLETFIFLGTFLCLEGDVREPSWLVFSLPFPPMCYISGKELTGLKDWIQLEEKMSLSLRVLGNAVACIRLQLCCGSAVVEPTEHSSSFPLVCIWEISTLQPRLGESGGWCSWGSTHLPPMGLLSCVHLIH